MANKGDAFRVIRDLSGQSPLVSPLTREAAAAFAYGFRFFGDAAIDGGQKAFLDETEIVEGKPHRRITFAFHAGDRVALEPMAGPETVSLATVWDRLASPDFAVANPGHPLAHIYAASIHLFQLRRKLLAGLQNPRLPAISDKSLDLAPVDTFPGDPLADILAFRSCSNVEAALSEPPVASDPLTFRPVDPAPIDILEFCQRWESSEWLAQNPDHPIAWVRRAFAQLIPLPVIFPPAGTPVGVPMERHQLIRRGRRRLWLPWFLAADKKAELIARSKMQ